MEIGSVKFCLYCSRSAQSLISFAYHDFAEVTDVSNFLADKVLDALDLGGLLEDEARWWLVKKSAKTLHVDSTVLGGKDVDHRFESHVNGA